MPVNYQFPPPERPDWYWRLLVLVVVVMGIGIGVRGCFAIDYNKTQLEHIQAERGYFNARLDELKDRIEDTNEAVRRLVVHLLGVADEDKRERSNHNRPEQLKRYSDPKEPYKPMNEDY